MGETPAAHLARLRIQYGERYRLDRQDDGRPVYVARERHTGRVTRAASVGALEGKLIEQVKRGKHR